MSATMLLMVMVCGVLDCKTKVGSSDDGTITDNGISMGDITEMSNPVSSSFWYFNPVIATSLPDPTLMRAQDGNFYLFATETVYNIPIFCSSDLVKWSFVGTAFSDRTRPDWFDNGKLWAPDINYIDGQYVLYYTRGVWGQGWSDGIGVATADVITGPYKDHGQLIDSQEIDVVCSIDQCYFEDDDGSKWIFWGSFGSGNIYAIQLSDDGLSIKSGAEKQKVADSCIEGTMIHKHGNYYYMIGSAGSCCEGTSSTYHLIVARSESLLGTYVDKEGTSAMDGGFSLLLSGNSTVAGPGHCSEILELENGETWLVYHGYQMDDADAGRVAFLAQIFWDSENWPYVVSETSPNRWDKPNVSGQEFTYSLVNYIAYCETSLSNGEYQYLFDTGYVPDEETKIEIKCRSYPKNKKASSTSAYLRRVFSSGESDNCGYNLFVNEGGTAWGYSAGGCDYGDLAPHEYDTDYVITADRNGLTINGSDFEVTGYDFCGTTDRLTLFSGRTDYPYVGRIYYVKIYEGDILVRDFEPCVRNDDGAMFFHEMLSDSYIQPFNDSGFSYGIGADEEKQECQ